MYADLVADFVWQIIDALRFLACGALVWQGYLLFENLGTYEAALHSRVILTGLAFAGAGAAVALLPRPITQDHVLGGLLTLSGFALWVLKRRR